MRFAFAVFTALFLVACAAGSSKLPSCDGSNLRPINPVEAPQPAVKR
jgi:hypothetical protein